jgi:hypothetical protein
LEDKYFKGFVPQIVGKYEVDAEGMRISYVRNVTPSSGLLIDADWLWAFSRWSCV